MREVKVIVFKCERVNYFSNTHLGKLSSARRPHSSKRSNTWRPSKQQMVRGQQPLHAHFIFSNSDLDSFIFDYSIYGSWEIKLKKFLHFWQAAQTWQLKLWPMPCHFLSPCQASHWLQSNLAAQALAPVSRQATPPWWLPRGNTTQEKDKEN